MLYQAYYGHVTGHTANGPLGSVMGQWAVNTPIGNYLMGSFYGKLQCLSSAECFFKILLFVSLP